MSWNPVSRDREAGWILSESPVFRCIILNGMNGHQVKREGKREPFLCDFQSVTCISDNRSGLFFTIKRQRDAVHTGKSMANRKPGVIPSVCMVSVSCKT